MSASAAFWVEDPLPSSEPDHVFWVVKPASNLEQHLREALLSIEFGYSDEDIVALSEKTGFMIVDERTPKQRATPSQLQSWPRDKQWRVRIVLSDKWVKRIRAFKEQRDEEHVRRAAANISDPTVRAAFIAAMLSVDKRENDRASKIIKLLNAISASPRAQVSVLEALDVLDGEGRESDPYIPLVRAHVALADYRTRSGPGYDEAVLRQLEQLEERLVTARLEGSTKTDSLDLQVINGQMARIYADLGNEDESVRRQWLSRFADMAARDAGQYRPGQIVELIRPATYAVSRPRQSYLQLRDLDAERAERIRMEESIDAIGTSKPSNADRVDAFNGDLDEGALLEERRRNKNRGTLVKGGRVRRYRPKYRYINVRVPIRNPGRINTVKRGAGAFDLVMLGFKYAGAARRMRELAEYMQKRDAIVDKIERQNRRVVPPKPPEIRAKIDELFALDRATRDPRRKAEIAAAIGVLRKVLEESRAAWPGL